MLLEIVGARRLRVGITGIGFVSSSLSKAGMLCMIISFISLGGGT